MQLWFVHLKDVFIYYILFVIGPCSTPWEADSLYPYVRCQNGLVGLHSMSQVIKEALGQKGRGCYRGQVFLVTPVWDGVLEPQLEQKVDRGDVKQSLKSVPGSPKIRYALLQDFGTSGVTGTAGKPSTVDCHSMLWSLFSSQNVFLGQLDTYARLCA